MGTLVKLLVSELGIASGSQLLSHAEREAGWVGCMKQQQAPKAVCGFARWLFACGLSGDEKKWQLFEMQVSELSLLCALLTGRAIKLPNSTGCRSRQVARRERWGGGMSVVAGVLAELHEAIGSCPGRETSRCAPVV